MEHKKDIDEIARELANNLSPEQLREKWEARLGTNGIAPHNEKTDAERAYWNKMVFRGTAPKQTMPVRSFSKEMEYQDARKKFWAILQFRAATIETLTETPFEWRFDEREAEIIKCLIRYFINDPAPIILPDGKKVEIHKGLFVYGSVGTGKTEIMQAFFKFCSTHNLCKSFRFTSMSAVHIEAKTNKDYDPVSENIMYDRIFDEFGRHTGPVIRFGDQLDINEAVVELRYERWKRYGQLSHFVANAQPNDLETMFSPMIFDRIREMCTSVLFPGKSKRT